MDLKKVLKNVKIRTGAKLGGVDISGVTDDSRKVRPGDLFIALRGYSVDASKFTGSALRRGARAVVAEKDFNPGSDVVKILVDDARSAASVIADNFYNHPSRKLKVVGVTGTNGKTTITYLIESIVKAAGHDSGVIGTINYRLNGKVLPAPNTTPGALVLQEMLADMAASDTGYAIMEVSSHSLDQGRVENVLFDAAIFTNLTGDHLDYHKTTANYFNAKKKLFDRLKTRGFAVLNMDDKKVAPLRRSLETRTMTYGVRNKADVTAENITLSMDGAGFTVHLAAASFNIRTKLVGIHNVSNILAAIAAATALNIPRRYIIKGIESMERVPGRLESVDAKQPFKVFVDFAHTEDALFNVLSILKEVVKNRVVTVFGCGGNRDRIKRPLMGKVACEYSDRVIITSDNPRFEDPNDIIDEIVSGIRGKYSNYDIVPDRKEAISKALGLALKDDIVVIAGKGHESYQVIGGRTMPFDDRKVAFSILKKMFLER